MKLEGAHHLQIPQNRPWYRFCNRLADRPLGRVSCLQGALEAGRVGLLGWKRVADVITVEPERLPVLRVLRVQVTR
jgi:hypothetical protein